MAVEQPRIGCPPYRPTQQAPALRRVRGGCGGWVAISLLNPNFLMAWRFGGAAHSGISLPYFFLRRYDQAVEWAERALRDRPRAAVALMVKVAALAMLGDRTVEIPDLVRQLLSINPRITAKRAGIVMSAFRPSDLELYQTALRKAGIPG